MKLKVIVWSISSLLLLIAGILFFILFIFKNKDTSEAIRAIPADAAIVIKSNNFSQLVKEIHKNNTFWNAIEGFELVSKTNKFFEFSEKLIKQFPAFQQIVNSNLAFMSVHAVGKGVPAILFTANLPERVKPSDITSLINDITGNDYAIEQKEYNGVRIYTYTRKNSAQIFNFSYAIHQGVVMYSQSLLLVESAVGQLTRGISLLEDKGFMEALKTAGTRVVLNVLVNHTRVPSLFSIEIHPGQRNGFQWIANSAGWSELDLTIRDDAFYLNGFTQIADTLNNFYKVFAKQKPVRMNLPSILPAQTAALVFLGISNFENYLESYKKFLEGRGRITSYNQNINRLSREMGFNPSQLYSSFLGKELALAFIPFEGESYANCWFIVAEAQSQSLARQELLKAITNYASKSGELLSTFERTFSIDKEKSVKIYRLPKGGLHKTLFGDLFSIVNDQYFTFIDSYIVFGSSVESISRLVLANIHNKQLAVEQSFKEFSQSLTSESNLILYINPFKAEILYGQMLEPSAAARLLSRMETMQKIQGIAIQLTGGKSMIFNNIAARYTPFAIDAPQTLWETRLDSAFRMKPQLVINHNTQNREIFVQDLKSNIYLINDVGRVLWKRPLSEEIIGEVNQVDIFRNGKLQFLFNTKTKLHLIDRNGNNVDGYPVTLRSPATNAVAIFDYERNHDYRFFIAGEDRKIYVYNKSGNIVTGWEFDKAEKHILQPIQYFRIDGRDYIVFADDNRPYILDRRGTERVKPSQYFSKGRHSSLVLETASARGKHRFVTTDSLGLVRFISLNGEVEDKAIKRFSSQHFFDYQDVDADGSNDFIFLDKNQLFVFKSDGKELFSIKFKHDLLPQVVYFHFGARDRKLGVTCTESFQIYLINSDGSLYNGFPLKGLTPFSIGRFSNTKSTFNLIVGSSAGYVLNYAVQ